MAGEQPSMASTSGLFMSPKETAGHTPRATDVTALTFGENGVERERGLARSGQPSDDGQLIPGDRDVDILEVVGAGAAYDKGVFGHSLRKLAADRAGYKRRTTAFLRRGVL